MPDRNETKDRGVLTGQVFEPGSSDAYIGEQVLDTVYGLTAVRKSSILDADIAGEPGHVVTSSRPRTPNDIVGNGYSLEDMTHEPGRIDPSIRFVRELVGMKRAACQKALQKAA